ncbi:MAG: hypothetical protein NZM37_06675 [Sandaracinaceae bacterium]|nr:hypothetical protein [Sandaracinaceae bacterium]
MDADGDGHRDARCGGSDCDDTDPNVHPGVFEPCNATRDLDCRPATPCPTGTRCHAASGPCVPECFEGGCGSDDLVCTAEHLCLERACVERREPCPEGTVCCGGRCVGHCEGVVCPDGQVCVGGACIDPCAGVRCPPMQVCIANRPGARTLCGPACTCSELTTSLCTGGTVCDTRPDSPTFGYCVQAGCESIRCPAGYVCRSGRCVDACEGVLCPFGQRCMMGECVVDRCASIRCAEGLICVNGECVTPCSVISCREGERCRNGVCEPDPCHGMDCGPDAQCIEGACIANPRDAGRPDGGRTPSSPPPSPSSKPASTGCGCRSAKGTPYWNSALALLVLLLLARRKR